MKVLVNVLGKPLTYEAEPGVHVGDEVEVPAFYWQNSMCPNEGVVTALGSDYSGKCIPILRVTSAKLHPYDRFIEELMLSAKIPRGKTKRERVQYMLGELDRAGLEMLTRADLKTLMDEARQEGYQEACTKAGEVVAQVRRVSPLERADCKHCDISVLKIGSQWYHDTLDSDRGCRAALFDVDEAAWLAWDTSKRRPTYAAPKKGTIS